MYICYVDESGGFEVSGSDISATPLMVLAGLVVDQTRISQVTREFIRIKRTYYPRLCKSAHPLGDMLVEIKGGNVRTNLRSTSRDSRRHAIGFLTQVVRLLEDQHAKIVGRVWIKEVGKGLDPDASYTFAVQDIARHYDKLLATRREKGLIICDSRMANQNAIVSHSVFTQKMQRGGDAYPHIAEVPVFGHSNNHAGLQLADLLASALLFPMAARTYCAAHWPGGVHVDPHYDEVKRCFARRCQRLEWRYQLGPRSTGGIIVSDPLGGKRSAALWTR